MTKDEILNMPAGREMDALIAEKVMGWKISLIDLTYGGRWENIETGELMGGIQYWNPSENISAAWEVVEKMKSEGWEILIQWANWNEIPDEPLEYSWYVDYEFYTNDVKDWRGYQASADTPSLAICRA